MASREFSSPYCSAFGPYYVAVFSLQNFCMALSSNVSQLVSMILFCRTALPNSFLSSANAAASYGWETEELGDKYLHES